MNCQNDDEEFKFPLQAKINNDIKSIKIRFSKKDNDIPASEPSINPITDTSEGDGSILTVGNVALEGDHDINANNSIGSESFGSFA